MARLILTRLLTLIPLMFLITSIVFFMVRFVPGRSGPDHGRRAAHQRAEPGQHPSRVPAGSAAADAIPLWVGDLLSGNLGRSYRQRTEVTTLIVERLPLTVKAVRALRSCSRW